MKEKALDDFLATRNASFYTGLRYTPEYVNYFLSSHYTTTAIRNEVLRFKDLKQLPRETEAELSPWVNGVAYRCGNEFLLGDKISTCLQFCDRNVTWHRICYLTPTQH